MPPELDRLAGAGGSLARSTLKRSRCCTFMGLSGSSAQARWLMTSVVSKAARRLGSAANCATSPSDMPSRLIPVSICRAAASLRPRALAVGGPIAHLGEAREGRAQVEARIVGLGPGQETVEHVDGGAGLHFARGASLVHGGDEKGLAAFAGQRPGDGRQAQAIGIGLDDACAFRAARDLVEPAPSWRAVRTRSTLRTARADNGMGARVRGKPVGAGVVAVNPSSLERRRPAPDRRSA